MFTRYALVEYHNMGQVIYQFKGRRKPTIKEIEQYLIKTEDFNEERDNIIIVDEITKVNLRGYNEKK